MKQITLSRRAIALMMMIMVGLVLSAALAGAVALNGSSVSTQPASSEETEEEDDDADDGDEGPDTPITGDALEAACAAALKHIGEGRVTDTEVGDEEGYYEVEITRDNGRQVDVHLDKAFNVLGHEDD